MSSGSDNGSGNGNGSGGVRASGRARGRVQPKPERPHGPGSPGGASSGSGDSTKAGGDDRRLRVRGRCKPRSETDSEKPSGTAVALFANYFKMTTKPESEVSDYRVDFEPEVELCRARRVLIANRGPLFNNAYVYDGHSNIKSLNRLPDVETVVHDTMATGTPIVIKIKYTGTIAWGSMEMLRLYNINVRESFRYLNFVQIFRDYYDPHATIPLPNYADLKLWTGMITAVGQYEAGPLMCCEPSFKVVRTDTVLDAMKSIYNRLGKEQWTDQAKRELVGSIVMTNYNNRTYKIEDIKFDERVNHTFERRGAQISFVQYYQEVYNVKIRDTNQPLLVVMPSIREKRAAAAAGRVPTPVKLVPELCLLTGLSEALRTDMNLKKIMTQSTQIVPNRRREMLKTFMDRLQKNADVQKLWSTFNLGYETELFSIQGRVLNPEQVYMRKGGAEVALNFDQRSSDFSREIRGCMMYRVKDPELSKWIIIHTARDKQHIQGFGETMARVCAPLGLRLKPAKIIELDGHDPNNSQYVQHCSEWAGKGAQLIVIVVPNNKSDRYNAIKKVLCCEIPTPSQVIVARTISKPQMLMSVCTKVGIQVAAKIGCEPWSFKIPPKALMVVGYDTYHDSSQKGRSVAGIVISMNDSLTSYYSRIAYHTGREEMSSNFGRIFSDGLHEYKKRNGGLPKTIVIYRDGVGEGMINHVYDVEVTQIQKAIADATQVDFESEAQPIKLTFIIVTKRINTRFMLKAMAAGQRTLENPSPGTIVDTGVTRPDRYEFYLISQSVRAGTVCPTHYHIILDTTVFRANNQQALAYKMCHLYYNWMGTIRVPAVCQYAHKLAYLTGTALHREPNPALSDRLFYL